MQRGSRWKKAAAMAKNVLDIARGELGNTESPAGSNRTKYGAWMGLDGQPWCMSFVQWCFDQAGKPLPHKTGSCSNLLGWYRRYCPERVASDPRPGDIIIYNFGHTGIVESADGSTITAIEGNTSPGEAGSQDNGGGVCRRKRSKTLVKAYIRAYDNPEKEDDMTGKEIYDALKDYMKRQKVPADCMAEYQEAVKLGITDGADPCQLVPRWQAALMAKRAAEKK